MHALKQRIGEFLKSRFRLEVDGQTKQPQFDRAHFLERTLRKTGVVFPDQDLDVTAATLGVIFVLPIDRLPESAKLHWDLFDERIQKIPAVATDEAGGLPWSLTTDDPVLEWKNFLTNPKIPAMVEVSAPPTRPTLHLPIYSLVSMFFGAVTAWLLLRVTSKSRGSKLTAALFTLLATLTFAIVLWPKQTTMAMPLTKQRTISAQEAGAVTESLLHNLYRSFDRRNEGLIYDRLGTCVSGDLLRNMYLQINQSIEDERQGGAKIKIDEVNVVSQAVTFDQNSPRFRSHVQWQVVGTIGHWGHLHRRARQMEADFLIDPADGHWKIAAMDVQDEVDLGSAPVQ